MTFTHIINSIREKIRCIANSDSANEYIKQQLAEIENDIEELKNNHIVNSSNNEYALNYNLLSKLPIGFMQIEIKQQNSVAEFNIVLTNQTASQILGTDFSNISFNDLKLLHPEFHLFVNQLHRIEKQNEETIKNDLYLSQLDKYIELMAIFINDTNIVLFFNDISKRKLDSEALLLNFNFLSSVLKAIPLPVFYQSPNNNYLGCNDSFSKITGISPEAIIDKTDFDIWSYRFARLQHKMNTEILRTRSSQKYEAEVPIASGGSFNAIIQKSPHYDANNEIAGIIGTFTDITKHVLTEEELNQTRHFFSDLLNHIPIPVYVKNEELKWILVNNAFCTFLSADVTEILGFDQKNFLNTEEAEKILSIEEQVYKNEINMTTEISIQLRDNSVKHLQLHLTVFNDLQNQKILVCAINDITQRKKVLKEIKKAQKKAIAADRAKSEFLANMSHEIRTPMNAIIGFTEIIKERLKDRPELHNYISGIEVSGKNLMDLISDILDLSKIEAGQFDIQREPVSIRKIVQEITQIFYIRIKEKNIEFNTEIATNLPEYLMIDETRLRQILFNLVGNAIKFTLSGSVSVNFKKLSESSSDYTANLYIEVVDTGIGIRKSQHELIFLPFMQQIGQRASKYGGTGLGLAITKRLVELMGGEISLESEVNAGSKFMITFYDVPIATHSAEILAVEDVDIQNLMFDKLKVLIADDVLSNRRVLQGFLSEHKGIEIIEAENGEEAVNKCIEHSPDIIFMDIRMPVMDGFEAIRIIKNSDEMHEYRSIPVIAMTGYTEKEYLVEMQSISDDYLSKPITKHSFMAMLTKYVKYTKIETVENEQFTNFEIDRLKSDKNMVELMLEDLNKFAKNTNDKTAFEEFHVHLKPVFETVVQKRILSSMSLFSQMLIEFGTKNEMESFILFGHQLENKLKEFDIEGIIKMIDSVIPLVDKISELNNLQK